MANLTDERLKEMEEEMNRLIFDCVTVFRMSVILVCFLLASSLNSPFVLFVKCCCGERMYLLVLVLVVDERSSFSAIDAHIFPCLVQTVLEDVD